MRQRDHRARAFSLFLSSRFVSSRSPTVYKRENLPRRGNLNRARHEDIQINNSAILFIPVCSLKF